MTFPAIVTATQSPAAGAAALVVGILCAWSGLGLLPGTVAPLAERIPAALRIPSANTKYSPQKVLRSG